MVWYCHDECPKSVILLWYMSTKLDIAMVNVHEMSMVKVKKKKMYHCKMSKRQTNKKGVKNVLLQ